MASTRRICTWKFSNICSVVKFNSKWSSAPTFQKFEFSFVSFLDPSWNSQKSASCTICTAQHTATHYNTLQHITAHFENSFVVHCAYGSSQKSASCTNCYTKLLYSWLLRIFTGGLCLLRQLSEIVFHMAQLCNIEDVYVYVHIYI